jgi:DNA helicase-2/ATP-dependent DNA helicase PcrA
MIDLNSIKKNIEISHEGDEKQLSVIFSESNRLLVEAPAGYGKTKTMVSKIAYMLSSNQIPYPKRILALTFSVNAAYKIKKDVTQNIPSIISKSESGFNISDKITVSNYHGFARRVLKKYGKVFHDNLSEIDTLHSIDDSDSKKLMESIPSLSFPNAEILSNFSVAVKNIDVKYTKDNFDAYTNIVISELLPIKLIPYNAILALSCKLLKDNQIIRKFYQKLYNTVLVDEFQDTNILSYWLLHCLLSDESNILVFGDSLQRIYGFIGAIPNLLDKTEKQFNLLKIELDKNYRFCNNPVMLTLDRNLRLNAENPQNPAIKDLAEIKFELLNDQLEEANFISKKAQNLLAENPNTKVAILVKSRGNNINAIIEVFKSNSIPFFFGLFNDDDTFYIKFNRECLFEFIELLRVNPIVTKKQTQLLLTRIKAKFSTGDALTMSLQKLLDVFIGKLFSDFSFLSNEEKILLVKDTFEHNGLKQYVEFVESNIIISTVHGAKGLEWDFVIIPDMESFSFPGYYGLCGVCGATKNCDFKVNQQIETTFLEELSVFYVAVTRARKQVYFCASKMQLNYKNEPVSRNISCLLKLPGIKI